MIDADNIPEVADDELLARFIFSKNEFRSIDNRVKPSLFIPHKHVELSVNRHLNCPEDELWEIGTLISKQRGRTLRGRVDILAKSCRVETLNVQAKPLIGNPNHADIVGFPPKKEDQNSLALKLVAESSRRIPPPSEKS